MITDCIMQRLHIWVYAMLLAVSVSCFKDPNFEPGFNGEDNGGRTLPERAFTQPSRRVMIMISAGFNSISDYLTSDLEELAGGELPVGTSYSSDIVMVLKRSVTSAGDYDTPSPASLYRLYKDFQGTVCRDTLMVWDPDTPLSSGQTIHEALSFIQSRFPAKGYGIVISSHASGWLPAGYYESPSSFEKASSGGPFRSIGQDKTPRGGIEMELKDFAEAIPMHLDYLLIDACLSGCVEVAYAFRDIADVVGFSPAEVLANGFMYDTITTRLLARTPDPVSVCKDYFAFYDRQSGSSRSATITAVAPGRMDSLVSVCRELFAKYRAEISRLKGKDVQGYFRYDHHYFYDLKDILLNAGINSDEEARLDAALEECILYKAATPYFLNFPIEVYSGMSMYLPSMGSPFLDNFYKTQIDWNKATELLK